MLSDLGKIKIEIDILFYGGHYLFLQIGSAFVLRVCAFILGFEMKTHKRCKQVSLDRKARNKKAVRKIGRTAFSRQQKLFRPGWADFGQAVFQRPPMAR